ncbi:stress response protein nst1-like [Actinia tenebrosa]|uniref:Stress response protein nst1-like n=1 Tax=Actinia tenebrosa TaxID=6105 RepID=A0A6P8J0C4_ACTTE|nr:stress response protein nst1-like [Actinia tenebrosa]
MNSKPNDDSGVLEVQQEITTTEETQGSVLESRPERIRRLNRERQRRRRMKLKMSRQDEPTMASESSSNVNMNLDNLEAVFENANTGHDRDDIEVKTDSEHAETGLGKTRATRRRISRRKRTPVNVSSPGETANQGVSESANNAITEVCHGGQLTTPSNELSEATDQLAVLVVASEIEVFGENPSNSGVLNGAGEEESHENAYADTGEAKRSTRSRKREDGDEARIPRRKRSSTNSEEEITVRREKQRELKRKQKERMTPDQVEALRARYREWRRRRKEVMTSEQLEIIRRGNRERQRRRRERLGVRKRAASTSSQSRGASEAVLQGIRNMQTQGRSASEASSAGDSSKGSVSELMTASGLLDDKTAPSSVMGSNLPSNLPTMVTHLQASIANNPNPQVPTTNIVSVPASYAQLQTTTIPVIGPQGTLLPGMAAGTFFPGVTMPGMQVAGLQGAIFPGMPVPGSAAQAGIIQSSGNQTITTIPMSGVPGIQTAQGGFLSGIPVTSTQGNVQGVQQTYPNLPGFPREGQVLHNFQTLLPITPVQGQTPGMTFITQVPFTSAGQFQGLPDPKYTVANQASAQVQGLPPVTQLVQVPIPVDSTPAEDPKPAATEQPGQTKGKPKTRGRKRNTSAAEMLASLSNYVPSTSTPMASMLSALASSARDRQSSSTPQGTEELTGENAQNKTIVIEASQGQQNPSQAAYGMYVTQPRGIDPYMLRTVVSTVQTHTTIDVNSNNYTLAATSNGPSNIPHMNTFLTAIGGPQRSTAVPLTAAQVTRVPGQHVVDADMISVAVATDMIQKATKGTNTGKVENPDSLISVGTMTDSLYRSSVATNTELANNSGVPIEIKVETDEEV